MNKYYVNFWYVENDNKDSKNYIICAKNICKNLNGEDDIHHGEFSFITDRELTELEIAQIIQFRWNEIMLRSGGSYNGFEYRDLRPDSFNIQFHIVRPEEQSKHYEKPYYENFPIIALTYPTVSECHYRLVKSYGFKNIQEAINIIATSKVCEK